MKLLSFLFLFTLISCVETVPNGEDSLADGFDYEKAIGDSDLVSEYNPGDGEDYGGIETGGIPGSMEYNGYKQKFYSETQITSKVKVGLISNLGGLGVPSGHNFYLKQIILYNETFIYHNSNFDDPTKFDVLHIFNISNADKLTKLSFNFTDPKKVIKAIVLLNERNEKIFEAVNIHDDRYGRSAYDQSTEKLEFSFINQEKCSQNQIQLWDGSCEHPILLCKDLNYSVNAVACEVMVNKKKVDCLLADSTQQCVGFYSETICQNYSKYISNDSSATVEIEANSNVIFSKTCQGQQSI